LLPLNKSILLLSSIVLTASLTSCAAAENYACAGFETGAQVESISVTGSLEQQPVVSFPSPLNAESIQSRVVIAGEGPVFTGRNLVEFEFAGYNGGNGQLIQQSTFDGTQTQTGTFGPGEVPNFCEALAGAKEGSRIVAIIPPDQAHSGEGVPSLGVGAADSFIFVIDLKRVFLDKATGDSVAPEAGLPTVVTAPDGVPGVTIPKTSAPTELRIAQLIRGSGDLVEEGQLVTLHYSGFLWDGSEKFDSSWDSGQAVQFQMQDGALIEGFLSAVIGQPVGSQVIAVIPPALGYGDAGAGTIPPGATLVFVIDILGTSN
jgi:FKBP-type peptidyl-prolyl cis-trans isomerase